MSRKLTVAEIARLVEGEFSGDGTTEIRRVAAFEKAAANEIAFLDKEDSAVVTVTNASCLIVSENFNLELPCPLIRVKYPKFAFARIAAILHPPKKRPAGIHTSTVVAGSATIGEDVFLGAFVSVGENSQIGNGTQIQAGVRIGDDVKIGENCTIHPNVVLEDNVTIGSGVILHAGVVIGADGFGYVPDGARHFKFPQIGTVVIEDDVEIGANSCVDRAALGETRVGRGTKIDNLVQIAHNDRLGENVIVAAMTGLSGSVELGDGVVLAGQVGIADHVKIEPGAIIGAKSAVFPHKIVRSGVWAGIPAIPLAEYKRQNAYINSIARLREEVKNLKKEIAALQTEKKIS